MNKITLRPCLPNDSEFYYAVKKTTLKEYVEKTWGIWDDDFQRERHKKNFNPDHSQIIQFQGTDIGILVIEEGEESVMLHNIEILQDYQNQGIGTYLLKNVIHHAAEQRKNVALQVFKTNPRARIFYQRLKFMVVTESETHFKMKLSVKGSFS